VETARQGAQMALQIIDGKAKLVKEDFCDGFWDCIGTCQTGAITIEERDAKWKAGPKGPDLYFES